MAEKDMSEKTLEELNDVFADIVNTLLFDGDGVITEDALSESNPYSNYTANGKIREQERDVVKYWNNNMLHIAKVGFENETAEDADMPLRVLSYDGAAYRSQFSPQNNDSRFAVTTIVLYFGYKKRWTAAKSIYERVEVPDRLRPFVPDYPINLFEIAYLTDEQVSKFKSDFWFVADYFVQMRKTDKYIPPTDKITHVSELLGLMSALTDDRRFVEVAEDVKKKEKQNMCTVLDEIVAKGKAEGIAEAREEIQDVYSWLFSMGRGADVEKATKDEDYYQKMLEEYKNR
ncbi:Rpn family recombination-promoting nuclease/putative transposase [Butyrivibrio sp. INlla16]|uniref:Rpn family recombination-promoting nuclease/putative transposase n=1 Tax=Butyrivibrio sp. INlla16 TaxID=1520807 RepID=UPI0008864268|nr:Rpn family recombination-promoting nuclease/putative transposase [Butyrivibrio sp. INlla16]SDB57368.1 Putative transposase, YhgA-like [Butyrivibrio sp. INlla16]